MMTLVAECFTQGSAINLQEERHQRNPTSGSSDSILDNVPSFDDTIISSSSSSSTAAAETIAGFSEGSKSRPSQSNQRIWTKLPNCFRRSSPNGDSYLVNHMTDRKLLSQIHAKEICDKFELVDNHNDGLRKLGFFPDSTRKSISIVGTTMTLNQLQDIKNRQQIQNRITQSNPINKNHKSIGMDALMRDDKWIGVNPMLQQQRHTTGDNPILCFPRNEPVTAARFSSSGIHENDLLNNVILQVPLVPENDVPHMLAVPLENTPRLQSHHSMHQPVPQEISYIKPSKLVVPTKTEQAIHDDVRSIMSTWEKPKNIDCAVATVTTVSESTSIIESLISPASCDTNCSSTTSNSTDSSIDRMVLDAILSSWDVAFPESIHQTQQLPNFC
jgi:hypothetical protein